MNTLQFLAVSLIWFALLAYGVFGGADFGGGIWDLLATGKRADKQRQAIAKALGPVWEANNVWLIFVIVGAFSCFPVVFSSLSIALSIPLTLALIGIVMRGSAFVFRAHAAGATGIDSIWGRVFSAASTITPFLFGMCAAAIASGSIRVTNGNPTSDYVGSWTSPFAFACGAFALGMCSSLAATYLTVEAASDQQYDLERSFRLKAIISGAVAAVVGLIALLLAHFYAPALWSGLLGKALPITIGAMLVGLATAFCLLTQRDRTARILLMLEITAIFVAWAVAQAPALIVPDVTIANAASPDVTLKAFLIASTVGMIFFLPSLWFLFSVFKGENPHSQKQSASS